MTRWGKKRWWLLSGILAVAVLFSLLGVRVADQTSTQKGTLALGVGQKVITLGHEALAAGSTDYTFGAANANVQFQLALNALPVTGGRLVVVSAVQINWAAGTTVTRVIPNVVIEGAGLGTSFVGDGVTPEFTAGGNGWVFCNATYDVAPAMGATTNWMQTNVNLAGIYYAYRSPYGQSVFNDVTVAALTDSGLTSGRIPIAGVGGLLGDDADLTFSGDTATITKISSTMVDVSTAMTYTGRTAGATNANGTTWVDLLDLSVLTRPEEIFGMTLTIAGTWAGLCEFRIVNALGSKIYPFDATHWTQNTHFASGSYLPLVPFRISIAQGYKVQFRSSNAGDGVGDTCALTLLDTFQK